MKLAIISHIKGKGSKAIVEEAKNYFTQADHLDIRKVKVDIHKDHLHVSYNGQSLEEYDCIYLRGSYKYALLNRSLTRALQHQVYMPIQPHSFTLAHNKLLTLLELQKNNLPIPHTYFAATPEVAKELLKKVHYPIILKVPEGGLGKGVMIADSDAAANSMIDALELFKQPYLIQEFIETKDVTASDLRILVAGGKVVGCMKRYAKQGEIRSNIHAKGRGIAHEPTAEIEQIAIKSSKLIGADICAIDILEGLKPAILEVNLSPGLEGITHYTNTNVANLIAKTLYENTKIFHAKKDKSPDVRTIMNEDLTQSFVSLHIMNGMIKLPKYLTDLTGFTIDDEVVISAKKGEFTVKEHTIKKDE